MTKATRGIASGFAKVPEVKRWDPNVTILMQMRWKLRISLRLDTLASFFQTCWPEAIVMQVGHRRDMVMKPCAHTVQPQENPHAAFGGMWAEERNDDMAWAKIDFDMSRQEPSCTHGGQKRPEASP